LSGKEKHTYSTSNADYQAPGVGALPKVLFPVLLERADGDSRFQPALVQLRSCVFIVAHPSHSLYWKHFYLQPAVGHLSGAEWLQVPDIQKNKKFPELSPDNSQ